MVVVRDIRLGMLYYILVGLVFVYIVVWEIWGNLHYLDFARPQHTVRMTLQQPTKNGCNPKHEDCEDEFPHLSSLPYCCQDEDCAQDSADELDVSRIVVKSYCAYFDGVEAALPGDRSLLITTHRKTYQQRRNASCAGPRPCEKLWLQENKKVDAAYVAGVEKFTLLIDHSVNQREFGIMSESVQMRGWLAVDSMLGPAHDLCQRRPDAVTSPVNGEFTDTAPCFIRPERPSSVDLDVIEVGDIVAAMGFSLDAPSYEGSKTSLRHDGLEIQLQIQYFNSWPWVGLLGQISYVYSFDANHRRAHKVSNIDWEEYPDKRLRQSNNGLYLSVLPAGSLGQYSFSALLLQASASVPLLAVIAYGIRYLATYVSREKNYYIHLFQKRSVDFSDVRDLEEMSDHEITAALLQRQLSCKVGRSERILTLLKDGWKPSIDNAAPFIGLASSSDDESTSRSAPPASTRRCR